MSKWYGLHLSHQTTPITLDHSNHPKPPFHPHSVVYPSAFQICVRFVIPLHRTNRPTICTVERRYREEKKKGYHGCLSMFVLSENKNQDSVSTPRFGFQRLLCTSPFQKDLRESNGRNRRDRQWHRCLLGRDTQIYRIHHPEQQSRQVITVEDVYSHPYHVVSNIFIRLNAQKHVYRQTQFIR